ncbi:MAG: prephenate dehydratase [Dehalococcoidia bacterium]|nr:prephenate dehydratase [Dehalococcoidia bacterium]MDP7240043.1 prephenate dehydratase [Dehalococcoidia bacterium]MDP7470147.1 prephenate dehydratase [Dehalococcoidia bacterium]
MSRCIGYLGPQGTFSEEAALLYDSQAELVPFPTISQVANAVAIRQVEEGVVPIENSIGGSVPETLDLLIQQPRLFICREVLLPIRLYLLVRPGTEEENIHTIFSHPQPLAQSQRFLSRYFPDARLMAAPSTAAAVEQMMGDTHGVAAIGTRRAARMLHAKVLAHRIQDYPVNVTRFVVLDKADHAATGDDRTSLCFSFAEDKPGQLAAVLQELASQEINMIKIESRPLKKTPGRYYFLVDLEGHRQDAHIVQSLTYIKSITILFRIFGSYPRHRSPAPATRIARRRRCP